jgi:hypothetical protein
MFVHDLKSVCAEMQWCSDFLAIVSLECTHSKEEHATLREAFAGASRLAREACRLIQAWDKVGDPDQQNNIDLDALGPVGPPNGQQAQSEEVANGQA